MAKEHIDKRIKKLLKNLKKNKKAGAFVGVGAGVGLIEGGSVGVAVAGTAFGIPLVVAGATVGLAGYGLYKAGESLLKETKNAKDTDKK